MKNHIQALALILGFCSLSLPSFCQNETPFFEGKINYSFEFVDKQDELKSGMVKFIVGDQMLVTVKGNKYKNEGNGKFDYTQYYLGGDSLLTTYRGNKAVLWSLVTENEDSVLSFTITEHAEEVNGIMCKLLTAKTRKGEIKYYFHEDYRANPEHFKRHHDSFSSFLIENTGCLALKEIFDMEDVYSMRVFTEIMPGEVADTEIQKPQGPRKKAD